MVLDDLPKRIASKIQITGHWEWTAGQDKDGYGLVRFEGKKQRAHRVVYELLVGPIPKGMTLDHLCRVRHCVDPTHLEPVTNRENILRGFGAAALRARQTHCIHGHEFTIENTYVPPRGVNAGHRFCRTCQRRRRREYEQRRWDGHVITRASPNRTNSSSIQSTDVPRSGSADRHASANCMSATK